MGGTLGGVSGMLRVTGGALVGPGEAGKGLGGGFRGSLVVWGRWGGWDEVLVVMVDTEGAWRCWV